MNAGACHGTDPLRTAAHQILQIGDRKARSADLANGRMTDTVPQVLACFNDDASDALHHAPMYRMQVIGNTERQAAGGGA